MGCSKCYDFKPCFTQVLIFNYFKVLNLQKYGSFFFGRNKTMFLSNIIVHGSSCMTSQPLVPNSVLNGLTVLSALKVS